MKNGSVTQIIYYQEINMKIVCLLYCVASLCVCLCIEGSYCQNISYLQDLRKHLFEDSSFNKRIRPVLNYSRLTEVR